MKSFFKFICYKRKQGKREKKNKEHMGKQKRNSKIVDLNPTISKILLNISGLNNAIKKAISARLDPSVCYLQETHVNYKDT